MSLVGEGVCTLYIYSGGGGQKVGKAGELRTSSLALSSKDQKHFAQLIRIFYTKAQNKEP